MLRSIYLLLVEAIDYAGVPRMISVTPTDRHNVYRVRLFPQTDNFPPFERDFVVWETSAKAMMQEFTEYANQ